MFSTNTKILTIAIAAISVLAFASILNDGSDADSIETEYSFYLLNTVEGEDSTHNGLITATGTTVVDALVKALTSNNIPFTGFTSESESVYFSDSVNICGWTNTYKYTEPDVYGTGYGIWNYNATDGWHMGNSVGLDCGQYQPDHKSAEKDTAIAIVHQVMYNTTGATAKTLGVSTNAEGDHFAPVGMTADDYTIQLAPRDVKATPDKVVFGLADDVVSEYTFILDSHVDGKDKSINGTYAGYGTNAAYALVNALNWAGVNNTLVVDDENGSIYFGAKGGIISDWVNTYDYTKTDVYGESYGIWNYNATDGWHMGNSVGLDCGKYQPDHKSAEKDTVIAIVYQTMYNTTGPTAKTLAVSTSSAEEYYAPVGMTADGYTVQLAPRDAKATPDKVVFGLADDVIKEYSFKLIDNYPEQGLADVSGVYSGYGVTPVQALVNALNDAEIEHSLDYFASSVYFSDKTHINHWTTPFMPSDEIMWVNYAIWNYNATDGWHLGNALGDECGEFQSDHKSAEKDIAFAIVHEPYYNYLYESAQAMGVSCDADYNFSYPVGLLATAEYGIQTAPRDRTATIEDVIFGLDKDSIKEFTFILDCSVDGKDAEPNGTYTGYGTNAAYALVNALNWAEIEHTIVVDDAKGSIYFGAKGGIISDWENTYDYTKTDVYGESYGIWNYNATDGWHMGNSVGLDCGKYQPDHKSAEKDTAIAIVYQTMYNTTGATAKTLGVSTNAEGDHFAPIGMTADDYTIQLAPRDVKATPDKVVFGLADDVVSEFTFILDSHVDGKDKSVNGTYTGYGTNAAYALVNALNWAGVNNTLVVDDENGSIYFGAKGGIISDWENTYDYTKTDVYGESYGIWNYNATDGWHMGNSVGLDCGQYQPDHKTAGLKDYVIAIVYQTMYNTSGATAKTLAVTTNVAGDHFAPVGMTADDYTVQLAPRDVKATPDKVIFGLADDVIKEYTFILQNTVTGEDKTINGTYTGYGVTPVQALTCILNSNEIVNNMDYWAESVWFSTGMISDWSSSWDMSATDITGANYSIWNYNAVDGWHKGNSLGLDCGQYQPDHKSTEKDTAFFLIHETIYVADGPSAIAMGVTKNGDVYECPEGLMEDWGTIYLDILDKAAAPEAVAVQPYSCIYLDLTGGTSDVTVVGGKVGAPVEDVAVPVKDGCVFLKWDPELPECFAEDTLQIKAVWAVQPVVKDDEVDVDLSEDSSFVMPNAQGKTLNVELPNSASIVLDDSSSIAAGSTVTATIEPVANPSTVKGTAFEFVFEADGTPVTGTIKVTVGYSGGSGKTPVVYFYNGTDVEEMKVVSYTSDSVTFETSHNSLYIIGTEDEGTSTLTMIFAIVMLVAILAVVVVTVMESRKLEQN